MYDIYCDGADPIVVMSFFRGTSICWQFNWTNGILRTKVIGFIHKFTHFCLPYYWRIVYLFFIFRISFCCLFVVWIIETIYVLNIYCSKNRVVQQKKRIIWNVFFFICFSVKSHIFSFSYQNHMFKKMYLIYSNNKLFIKTIYPKLFASSLSTPAMKFSRLSYFKKKNA